MKRLRVLAFALALTSAVPGVAEPGGTGANAPTSAIRFSAEGMLGLERRGFSFPVIEYTDQTGARQQRKGIIAGREIAPDTLIGIGLFETSPRTQGYWGDVPLNVAPRRSRRSAAIGLNWRF